MLKKEAEEALKIDLENEESLKKLFDELSPKQKKEAKIFTKQYKKNTRAYRKLLKNIIENSEKNE